ncbi:MAG: nucleotidyltransferase family protein [Methanomicrobiaceae archaeon]|nr:nucleotidyltransferase family protein [Methanomicrobiaceae archaeon]
MRAVIHTGGDGRGFEPYSNAFPRPLMPVGDRPVLEIILGQLKSHGFDEAILSVGHLAGLMMAFFGDGSRFGIPIRYSREMKPLGMAGCLDLLRDTLDATFLLMSGDVLTTLDFSEIVRQHQSSGSIATAVLHKRHVPLDFGIVETDTAMHIVNVIEKPRIEHLANMGIYIFEPDIMEYIRHDEYQNLPGLIRTLIRSGETIHAYLSDGYYRDVTGPGDPEWAGSGIPQV